jgi:hypothetical protein
MSNSAIEAELERLTAEFFRAVSFEEGGAPPYAVVRSLFIDSGLLIKNTTSTPEISTVDEFIRPRQELVRSGALTRFKETELSHTNQIFGNVAHRFSVYAKEGTMKGERFEARGMISTQFVLTPSGWKMSAMAWDDERPGLSISFSISEQLASS